MQLVLRHADSDGDIHPDEDKTWVQGIAPALLDSLQRPARGKGENSGATAAAVRVWITGALRVRYLLKSKRPGEPINSSSSFLLCGRSLLITRKHSMLWSFSGSLCKLLGENKNSRRENGVNWHPNVIVHFAPCVRDGCHQKVVDAIILPGDGAAVWRPLEPSKLRLYWKDRIYMVIERERG